jgi:hypothetical protein
MSRSLDGDDPFEEEEYRRRCAQDRLDRAREQASLHSELGLRPEYPILVHPNDLDKARKIVEPKVGSDIPPDVAERQTRFYRELLREENDGDGRTTR